MKWHRNMEPLDFSRFSGILLEDYDGNLQPMSQPYFKAAQIAEGTWQVLSDGDFTYVVEGDDEAIVIDSGLGAGNIREFCQSLVPGKQVYRLLNTHNHFDHTCNNYLFDVVYMSEACYLDRCRPFTREMDIGVSLEDLDIPDDYPVVFLKDGDVINLKGRPLEVINVEEHCIGSLQFLDRKARILFSGDELTGQFLASRISVEHTFRNVARWKSLRGAYDLVCAGCMMVDASIVDKYYDMLAYILDGHEDIGQEYYKPCEDPVASIAEKDGKPVYKRRPPHLASKPDHMIAAGLAKHLEYNEGRSCMCYLRKLTEDGMFDRQYEKDGARVVYYRNRIWDRR